MQTLYIFLVIWLAMIAHAFWESSVEGRNAWDRNKYGWKLQLLKNLLITRYHFWLFFVYLPLLVIVLPLVVAGFSIKLLGVLLSAYFSGLVIEDFSWFLVNTEISFKEAWNPKFASYYPWLIIGRLRIPLLYIIGIALALIFWFISAK